MSMEPLCDFALFVLAVVFAAVFWSGPWWKHIRELFP